MYIFIIMAQYMTFEERRYCIYVPLKRRMNALHSPNTNISIPIQ